MDLSPEEYGEYWGGAIRVAVGVLVVFFGYRLLEPLFSHAEFGATALGIGVFAAVVFAGAFLVTLGVARTVRTAVDAELRR